MKSNQSCFAVYFVLISILPFLILGGCAEPIPGSQQTPTTQKSVEWIAPQSNLTQRNFQLLNAEWLSATKTLNVAGTANNISERISIKNSNTNETIATTITVNSLDWTVSIKSLVNVPCQIDVVSESGNLQSTVTNAPINCNSSANVTTLNDTTPNAIITSPQTDLSIQINESVNFEAAATNVSGNPNYNWQFNGVTQNSSIQNPGNITFPKPGVYHITLSVSDSRGLADPTPAMRMITVRDPLSVLTAQPIANIDTPMGDQVIMVGDTLNFSGSGNDPASNEVVTFLWNFAGVTPNSTMQNPGDIVFNNPGIFTIVLSVSDSLGNIGTSQIMVTVNDPMANQAPVGTISSPLSDLIINPGDTILVEGSATDPDANDPITYLWEFDDVVPNSTMQNPGEVTYPDPGTYTIRLTATDSLGLSDPNPPTRVITVQAAAPISSDLPNGEILTPTTDTAIMAGESLVFTATGTAAPGNEPFTYLWSFDGVAPNSASMDTGPITFPNPGIYTVTLLVLDALNQMDPTPAVRVITVQDPNAGGTPPPSMPSMINHIVTPETDMTILPGEAVNFSGSVDPEVNPPYTYLWLFDGAAPNASSLFPGDVVFTEPGVYNVMFFAIDQDGFFDVLPAQRTITVSDSTAAPNLNPITSIVNPADDISINVGDTIDFEGSVVDVSGNGTLEYLWTFGGAAIEDTNLVPAPVTFSMPGVYEITFSAWDTTTMLGSIQPASILVTVNEPMPVNPAAPIAEIVNPAQDTTITQGDSINFEGNAIDTSGNGMLIYIWSFGGAAPDSNALSPGMVLFETPGEYNVTFTVIDTADPTGMTGATVSVTITVMPMTPGGDMPPPQDANLPQGIITEPVGDQTIMAGGTIVFSGEGINPVDNDPLNFVWDFGDGTSSTAQVPGSVSFNQVGEFTVSLSVNHDGVEFDPTPAQLVVTVMAPGGGGGDTDPPQTAP